MPENTGGNHNERDGGQDLGQPYSQGNRDFRLTDKITVRPVGMDKIDLIYAGDPHPKSITSAELAGLIEDRWFSE